MASTIEFKKTIEVEEGTLDDRNFMEFKSFIRFLSDDQCRVTLRLLVLGQPAEDAECAILARIADYLAFGEKYSDLPREDAIAAFKDTLTYENLKAAWEKCGF